MSANKIAEEMKKAQDKRLIEGNKNIDKWSKVKFSGDRVGKKILDLYEKNPVRARNIATTVEYQERHIKAVARRFGEAVVSSQFQVKPEYLIKIIMLGMFVSNRGNIFTEIPLETTDDALYYVDRTYEKTLRDVSAGDLMNESVSKYYASAANTINLGTGDGGTTNFNDTITVVPVMRNSIRLIVGGALVGSDDGNGNITSSLLSAGTINYTTGVVDITFTTAPAVGVSIDVEYIWDAEQKTLYDQYGKMSISVRKERFNAYLMPLGFEYTQLVEVHLNTTLGIDVDQILTDAVKIEHAKARDYRAITLARQVAMSNAVYEFDASFADVGEYAYQSHAQRILPFIMDIGGDIFDDLKRGRVNKVIAGTRAQTYLTYHKQWKTDTTQPRQGVYLAGMLDDIEVYVCPKDANMINNDQMIVSYKNEEEEMDVPIVFGTVTELAAKLLYPDFHVEGNVGTVEDNKVLNSKFLRLINMKHL